MKCVCNSCDPCKATAMAVTIALMGGQVYHGYWNNKKDLEKNFEIELSNELILFAAYEIDGYDGRATVIFMQDGKLYEVNGSHCSCFGLENQWDPEETTWEVLLKRPVHASLREQLQKIANAL